MHLSSPIGDDPCELAARWILDPTLAFMLVAMEAKIQARFTSPGFRWPGTRVISGFRTDARQADLNPAVTSSCHTVCPSLAVDVQVGAIDLPARTIGQLELLQILGGIWKTTLGPLGPGRWGGDFSVPDPNHFDLGPCL